MTTIGKKISEFRKEKGIKQEQMAELCGVSPQAVSKWENDISCPDILLLPKIAEIFDITVDELLSEKPKNETHFVSSESRKKTDDLVMTISHYSHQGDFVSVNIPFPVVKAELEEKGELQVQSIDLYGIDLKQLIELAEKGAMGILFEKQGHRGDSIQISVE